MSKSMQYVSSWVQIISFSINFQVPSIFYTFHNFILWLNKIPLCICATFVFSVHHEGCSGRFLSLDNRTMNGCVRISVVGDGVPLVYARSSITKTYCSSNFWFFRSLHTDFNNGFTSLCPTPQCIRVPHATISCNLMVIVLPRVRWNLTVALICISQLANDMIF